MLQFKIPAATLMLVALAACSSHPRTSDSGSAAPKSSNGRYSLLQDQGPDVDINVDNIPDAVPKIEPRTIAGNMSPYNVLGKTYSVQFNTKGFTQTGYASWYGKKFHGERTSNGEIYNMFAMTAAHKTLPIPCYVRVTNLENNRVVTLRVNDRGPFHDDRIIDLTYTAAKKLGFQQMGTARVRVDILDVGDSQNTPIAAFKPVASNKQLVPVVPAVTETKITSLPAKPNTAPSNDGGIGNKTSAVIKNSAVDAITPTYLQVGSFGTQGAAENLQKSLKGVTRYPIILIPVEGKNLFRVLIGPFAQNSEIQIVKQQLIDKKLSNPYVVQGIKKS